jgi:hypothetical protein
MAFQPPIELTWRNLFKASFLAIGDGALIAMIKDTSIALQTAMVVASIIGFTALVKEDWLRSKYRYAFQIVLSVSGAIFLIFATFAIEHAYKDLEISKNLDEFRGEGLLLERKTSKAMNSFEYSDWKTQIDQWQNKSASYLKQNMGSSYEGRFLNTFGHMSMSYGSNTPEFNHLMNELVGHGKNLQEIIDGRGHAK